MALTVQDALKQATFFSDDEPYLLVRLPPTGITAAAGIIAEIGDPFAALVVDKDEVTMVVPHEAVEEFGRRMREPIVSETTYRLITIDVMLPPDLVGFMAVVSRALADAGVTILPYAAFSRDHLIVPTDQFETAIQALERLRSEV